MKCTNCGKENDINAKYCAGCGAELQQLGVKKQEVSANPGGKKKNKKALTIILILGLLVALGIPIIANVGTQRRQKAYERYMLQAEKHVDAKEYEQAEECYLNAIEVNSGGKKAYFELSDLYIKLEEKKKALEVLKHGEYQFISSTQDYEKFCNKEDEVLNYIDYSWVTSPKIVADDIYYVRTNDANNYSANGVAQQFGSPYAVVKKDDALGMIDMNGHYKTEFIYEDISAFSSFYLLTSKEPQYAASWNQYTDKFFLDNNGNFYPAQLGGGFGVGKFYWKDGIHHMDEDIEAVSRYITMPVNPIPIKKSESIYNEESFSNRDLWWEELPGKYAICKNGKLTTDFIYDECGAASNGVLAVCIDGKWGYVNEEGKTVIPIEYDASWTQYKPYGNTGKNVENQDYCYAASEGYIPLCKNNQWELRDIYGNLAIPSGVFEEILPIYNGKCWVKKDGKWGVIHI